MIPGFALAAAGCWLLAAAVAAPAPAAASNCLAPRRLQERLILSARDFKASAEELYTKLMQPLLEQFPFFFPDTIDLNEFTRAVQLAASQRIEIAGVDGYYARLMSSAIERSFSCSSVIQLGYYALICLPRCRLIIE